ncbi:hypothetical protein BO71DRAFT_360244 [Aspergillus ellipticus CBS 707.79]|uniref:Uncharacterized protein n=1 Tax=Aspergillus ellipticus CBS 707.79 TaxID=1448320 RepID=A0A319D980_9EURO|nr:hypothetical protein BO71DRAFT_360244 [Aspergillus ellipticus CBS 707.79]
MSATIRTRIVQLDELIPTSSNNEREEKDVERLVPWVFRQADTAEEDCIDHWPDEDNRFCFFFDEIFAYRTALRARKIAHGWEYDETGITSASRSREIVTLPARNWKLPGRERSKHFIRSQGMILRILMQAVYQSLDGIRKHDPEISFPISPSKSKYVIGHQQYRTKPQGEVTVGPPDGRVPIISYTGWFEEQTWSDFLEETLSVMIGQLATNLRRQKDSGRVHDQEVFVVGFHGRTIHIARGSITADEIARIHSQGCSEKDRFELHFTRGYDLCLKDDWLEATRALTRLFRYLLSGGAKVSAMEAYFESRPGSCCN